MRDRHHFLLTAGGTGGHMMPAHALAAELMARGHTVALVTDERGARIPDLFDGVPVHVLPAGRMSRSPLAMLKAANAVRVGRARALALIRDERPAAVVGFGGYPALPSVLAARTAGVPVVLHEQNAVLGRVNRLVVRQAAALATSAPDTSRVPASAAARVTLVGNPVRDEVLALRDRPYPDLDTDGPFRVLVTGGSQGASVLSEVVPDGLGMLPEQFRTRLQVVQQARAEEVEAVSARYRQLGIPAEVATYLSDLPDQLSRAHLVIGRAGASTVSELTAAGRPAILIPLPSATDDHQTANAREMAATGGARVIPQPGFQPKELARQMQALGLAPDALAAAAARARGCGRPDATRRLADLVEGTRRQPIGRGAASAPVNGRLAPA